MSISTFIPHSNPTLINLIHRRRTRLEVAKYFVCDYKANKVCFQIFRYLEIENNNTYTNRIKIFTESANWHDVSDQFR